MGVFLQAKAEAEAEAEATSKCQLIYYYFD